MRKVLLILLVVFCCIACTDHRPQTSATLLLQRLDSLRHIGCMLGHQDDPMYGVHWKYENLRSDVLESCGDWPAVMGFDLGGIEVGDSLNLDGVPFDRMRLEIQAHHRRGGIITLSWHPRNPLSGESAWDAEAGVVTAVLAEGETHELFLSWLQRLSAYIATLVDDNGQPVPLIFRPWHENNGFWFWWGDCHCTPDEYKALWNLTQDYMTSTAALGSLLWCYSPNLQGGFTDSVFLVRYPGDDRVDIIGLDAYQWGTEEDYMAQTCADLDYLCAYGSQHHKPVALTECGRQSMPDPSWWGRVLMPILKAYSLSYALLWRNEDMKEHFGPVPYTESADEFKTAIYDEPYILFLNDIAPSPFVRTQAGRFWLNGQPYRYIGTNFWYGAILASQGQGGNRERLVRELDYLQSIGVTNLRILVGSDGERGVLTKVEPTLQLAPGVYNDTVLDGLDYLLFQMAERNMKAVLYLNNSWEWSGGYSFYLEQAGYGKAPRPEEVGYEAFMNYVAQFADAPEAQQLFFEYVRFIISRTNRYTHLPYADDPTIMAWQIGNEPRAFGKAQKSGFADWLKQTSALIRSIDHQHLISVGSEGIWGCEMDSALYRTISADSNIDYMTAHIWPYNWSWVHAESLVDDIPLAIRYTTDYLASHVSIAQALRKPLVIEEFGFPRDNMSYSAGSPTLARDAYYSHIFSLVADQPSVAGCNFWSWGGYARPEHSQWLVGDDYTGDPAQEPQGLNSVFVSDTTTISVIKSQISNLK